MSDTQSPSRRRFLVHASTAVVASTGVAGALNTPGCAPAQPTGDTTVADIPVGTFRSGRGFILGRDAGGFYAYTNVCTHMGCTVPAPANAMSVSMCPCHMSNFNAVGDVMVSPPGVTGQANLAHLTVNFAGTGATAVVTVDTTATVADRARRFPPPA